MRSRRLALIVSLLGVCLLLGATRPALADNDREDRHKHKEHKWCELATLFRQGKCKKDDQCCPGFVCDLRSTTPWDRHDDDDDRYTYLPTQWLDFLRSWGRHDDDDKYCQPGCRIGGTSFHSGAVNPANACQSCQPGVSTTAWSERSNGATCNDGNLCTTADTCQAGVCVGAPLTCTASDQCHAPGVCDQRTGLCSDPILADGMACNDGIACTQQGSCQAGVCTSEAPDCRDETLQNDKSFCDLSTGQCVEDLQAAEGVRGMTRGTLTTVPQREDRRK